MFKVNFERIYYAFPETDVTEMRMIYLQKLKAVCPILEPVHGLPQLEELDLSGRSHILLIVDDLSESLLNSKKFLELFFLWSHHAKMSLIYTLQNAFLSSKYGKSMSRNSSHYCIFANKADLPSIDFLSRNVYRKSSFLSSCFSFMQTELEEYGANHYVFVNAHARSSTSEFFKTSTNIFPGTDGQKRVIFLNEKNV
jgi:hypothetical protein